MSGPVLTSEFLVDLSHRAIFLLRLPISYADLYENTFDMRHQCSHSSPFITRITTWRWKMWNKKIWAPTFARHPIQLAKMNARHNLRMQVLLFTFLFNKTFHSRCFFLFLFFCNQAQQLQKRDLNSEIWIPHQMLSIFVFLTLQMLEPREMKVGESNILGYFIWIWSRYNQALIDLRTRRYYLCVAIKEAILYVQVFCKYIFHQLFVLNVFLFFLTFQYLLFIPKGVLL